MRILNPLVSAACVAVFAGCSGQTTTQKSAKTESALADTAPTSTPELGLAVAPPATEPEPAAIEHSEATTASPLPRLIDFSADWCPPCQQQKPIIEQLTRELAGMVQIEVVDVDQNQPVAQQYGIQVIPTQVFLDAEGREVGRNSGLLPRDSVLARLRTYRFID